MVELARQRRGDDADLQDWTAPLSELRRVLKPGGRLLLPVNHPRILESSDPSADYFSVTQYSDEYTFDDGQRWVLTFWHRPLHAMTDAFTAAGFRIAVISKPPFSPDTPRELLPPELGDQTAFICFTFFVLDAHTSEALPSSNRRSPVCQTFT